MIYVQRWWYKRFLNEFNWLACLMIDGNSWSDIWNVSYIELRIWNQVSHDHRIFERNLSNCEQKPEKVRTSTGFEPVEVLTFSGFCSQLLKLRSKLRWSWLTWDGNSLYSFAALKENDLWPVANLHLGKFKSELRLVFLLWTEERLTNLLQR